MFDPYLCFRSFNSQSIPFGIFSRVALSVYLYLPSTMRRLLRVIYIFIILYRCKRSPVVGVHSRDDCHHTLSVARHFFFLLPEYSSPSFFPFPFLCPFPANAVNFSNDLLYPFLFRPTLSKVSLFFFSAESPLHVRFSFFLPPRFPLFLCLQSACSRRLKYRLCNCDTSRLTPMPGH